MSIPAIFRSSWQRITTMFPWLTIFLFFSDHDRINSIETTELRALLPRGVLCIDFRIISRFPKVQPISLWVPQLTFSAEMFGIVFGHVWHYVSIIITLKNCKILLFLCRRSVSHSLCMDFCGLLSVIFFAVFSGTAVLFLASIIVVERESW